MRRRPGASLVGGDGAAQRPGRHAAPGTRRLGVVYVPNGIHMPDWTPTKTGRDYKLPPILEPLADLKSEFSILSGLATHRADGPSGNHARAWRSS